MKTTKLITTIAVSAGLAFGVAAQAGEKKHEEQKDAPSHNLLLWEVAKGERANKRTVRFARGTLY